MNEKSNGRLAAKGRVGMRDRDTDELVAVYPYKVDGTDEQINDRVKYWFYQRNCEAEEKLKDYYVDSLNPLELKNAQEKFLD